MSGITSQARIFGGCLGLTLSNLILNEVFKRELSSVLQPSELNSLRQSLEFAKSLTEEQQKAVSTAFAVAFAWQFRLAAGVAAIGIVAGLACWTRHPVSLKQRLEIGEKIARHELSPEEGDELLREHTFGQSDGVETRTGSS